MILWKLPFPSSKIVAQKLVGLAKGVSISSGPNLSQLGKNFSNLRKSYKIFCLLPIHKLEIKIHSSQNHYRAQREPVKCLTLSAHLKTAADILAIHHLSIITRVTQPVLTMSCYEMWWLYLGELKSHAECCSLGSRLEIETLTYENTYS